jgi:hypothetical protein
MRLKILLLLSVLPAAAWAQAAPAFQGRPASAASGTSDFCAKGKFLLFTGNCSLPPDSPYKATISLKACADVNSALSAGLSGLYPYAGLYTYRDLTADSVRETLMQSSVLGFFFIGEGDFKGGFITGKNREVVYPEQESCISMYDVFGGFTSHSKYSPEVPAPKRLRGKILARAELVYKGAGAPAGSWPRLCYPKVSLVYPTRTSAGRMKNDALKLLDTLQERKKEQVLEVLQGICRSCDSYARSDSPLAKLCPPLSDACGTKQISPDTAKVILENYCYAIHPELVPAR